MQLVYTAPIRSGPLERIVSRHELGGLQYRLGLKAVKAYKHVNHATVGDAYSIADGVELAIKRHAPATGTDGYFRLLQPIR